MQPIMKTIFIVDDDEMLAMMLEDHLCRKDLYHIHTFGTGEECLENLRIRPDVVVLDYNLNSVDANAANGIEILRKIKQYDKEILVIMYSSEEPLNLPLHNTEILPTQYVLKDQGAFAKIEHIIAKCGEG